MKKVLSSAHLCVFLWFGGLAVIGSSLAVPPVVNGQSTFTVPASPLLTAVSPSATPVPAGTGKTTLPAGTVVFYEEDVTLLTYPLARYQSDVLDPTYNWPYKRFDMERFRVEAPTPAPHTYRQLVLENAYLKILILPELGGRIWQVIHKPSGKPMFYQNDVVKPTHWGFEAQKGWLALGGLEWSLPVIEHGYDWGTPWDYKTSSADPAQASVTVSTPQDGRLLNATITIALRADEASFTIEPTLTNLADRPLAFSFWQNAMLAPGSGKRPSAKLHFVLPGDAVTVHSTNDAALPQPGQRLPWPLYGRRDLSRLGNFRQYLGFFEAPAAHGPFVGVYDPTYDAGAVRVFPAEVARGSKVFSLGWQDALTSDNFTDDDSMYVELHGGLAPTFDDQYQLRAKGNVRWRETWYPITGIGDLTFANEHAAIAVQPRADQLAIGLYVTQPITGTLVSYTGAVVQERVSVQASPDHPYQGMLAGDTAAQKITNEQITNEQIINEQITKLELQDSAGRALLTYQLPQN